MLRAKVLPEVLGQIIGDGVTASMYAIPFPTASSAPSVLMGAV
jgi:hypothetical protein